MIFARKINKIPEFYMIFAPNVPEFYIIIARKIFFPIFFLWGGALANSALPLSWAYAWLHAWTNHYLLQMVMTGRFFQYSVYIDLLSEYN